MTDNQISSKYKDACDFSSIKTFDFKTLKPVFSMCIYGKSFSGKTHMMKSMLKTIKNRFDKVYIFCHTYQIYCDGDYCYVPQQNAYTELRPDVISKVFEEQKELYIENNKRKKKRNIPNILMIFDDIISENEVRHCQVFNQLYIEGRHYGITVIVNSQSISGGTGIPKIIRDNTNYVVSFFVPSQYDRELLLKQYGSILHWKQGDEYFRNITADKYHCVVFDCIKTEAREYSEMMYKYCAPEKTPNFTIGLKSSLGDDFNEPNREINGQIYQKSGRVKYQSFLSFDVEDDGFEITY